VAERLRAAIAAEPVGGTASPVHMTISAGVVAWQAGESLDDMLRRADAALYKAKDGGRDRVVTG